MSEYILIPTCKTREEIQPLIDELTSLRVRTPDTVKIIATCTEGSAAKNRNIALSHTKVGDLIVMMDDDMTGFFPEWFETLTSPFYSMNDVLIISARLLRPNRKLAHMMGDVRDFSKALVESNIRKVPTACISFVNRGVTFDEAFIGSGFEDDDFCKQMSNLQPDGKFLIHNGVQLIHLNEMKNQGGEYWSSNKKYFLSKWSDVEDTWHD